MDVNLILAIAGIAGTLLATIISAPLAYYFQNKVYEREKKWALELENKRIKSEVEAEERRLRRELLSNRLNVIEEAANLMMFLISGRLNEEMGEIIHSEKVTIYKKRERLEEISQQAWTATKATGSADLAKNYGVISSALWQSEEVGTVDHTNWDEASKGFIELIKIIDDMKVRVR